MKTTEERGGLRMTGEGGGIGFRRSLLIWLFMLLVLLVTGAVVVRLDGGRDLIQSALEKRFGMPVTIERCRIGWPYDLVMENVRCGTNTAGHVYAGEVRVGIGGPAQRRIAIQDLKVDLVQDEQGRWGPGGLSEMGSLPEESYQEITRLTRNWRRNTALEISDGTIRWVDGGGAVIFAANGFHFKVRPVRLFTRGYFAYELGAYVILDSSGLAVNDPFCLWLAGSNHDYIEIERRIATGPGAGWPR